MKVLAKIWKIWIFSRPGRKLIYDQETVQPLKNRLIK